MRRAALAAGRRLAKRDRIAIPHQMLDASLDEMCALVVTDNGGLLSHAAIVSREYGIPGVVGTREATERITNGVLVRVDGDAGEVTVLG